MSVACQHSGTSRRFLRTLSVVLMFIASGSLYNHYAVNTQFCICIGIFIWKYDKPGKTCKPCRLVKSKNTHGITWGACHSSCRQIQTYIWYLFVTFWYEEWQVKQVLEGNLWSEDQTSYFVSLSTLPIVPVCLTLLYFCSWIWDWFQLINFVCGSLSLIYFIGCQVFSMGVI